MLAESKENSAHAKIQPGNTVLSPPKGSDENFDISMDSQIMRNPIHKHDPASPSEEEVTVEEQNAFLRDKLTDMIQEVEHLRMTDLEKSHQLKEVEWTLF
mmetsp:Transcript_11383/g.17182  ORF Transcript_11383/g.17182 Transcript_11383/m.17182 type:complete len:100 (+) Transcript_11383:128-427(+)